MFTDKTNDLHSVSPIWQLKGLVATPPMPFEFTVFGLRANHSTWKRLLDTGPASQQEQTQELKDYLEFWGNKAHQRQFKDGRLQYCVGANRFKFCLLKKLLFPLRAFLNFSLNLPLLFIFFTHPKLFL